MTAKPLVTVLTPVYNGARYLSECLESVRAQTYAHWNLVVVDNASTDGTSELLREHASRDTRIRVSRNERLVGVIENHNLAARQISSETKWVKFLAADDALFPECLDRMVDLGEAHASVGLVVAYQRQGGRVGLTGVPSPTNVVTGRTACRQSLFGHLAIFGNPTSSMIRADLVRRREKFFDEANLHADTAACYDVLQTADLGFVHEVLTYARLHTGSVTFTVARRLNSYLLGHLQILNRYGGIYLTPDEYRTVLNFRLDAYYAFLVRALLSPARREIWKYHCAGLRTLGLPLSRRRLIRALRQDVQRALASPWSEVGKVRRAMSRPSALAPETEWKYWWSPTGFEAVPSLDNRHGGRQSSGAVDLGTP